eukprot:scaffold192_cov320-Ochromonas_danica.AAC.16
MGSLVYGLLTTFYGSYDQEYAWTITAAYLSGIEAGAVLIVLFLGMFGLLCFCVVRFFNKAIVTDEEQHLPHSSPSPPIDAIADEGDRSVDCDGSEGVMTVHNELHAHLDNSLSVDSISNNTAVSKPQSPLNWKAVVMMKLVISLVNVLVVLLVNGFYVYTSLQLQRSSAMMLSVALSLFKVFWSLLAQTCLVRFLQPLQRLSSEGGLHQDNVGFMSSLMLFNTIVAPGLAAMIASSDCFYDVFASPRDIVASYTFQRCVSFDKNSCFVFDEATATITFTPPFTYTFQCVSAILVDYAYVFAYKYILIGVLYPSFIFLVVCFDGMQEEQEKTTMNMSYRTYSLFWHNTRNLLLPPMWRLHYVHAGSIDQLSARSPADGPTRVSSLPSSTSEQDEPTVVLFSAAEYSVRLAMILSCLLTFGVAIPYLAVLIGFSITSNTYLMQIGWLQQWKHHLSPASNARHKVLFDRMCQQCDRLFCCIRSASLPLFLFLPFFFSYLLFDVTGDESGWKTGLYFGFALLGSFVFMAAAVVVLALFRMQQGRQSPHIARTASSLNNNNHPINIMEHL